MMWLADVKIAIASLKATRIRTLLTVVGIVVGVASVTTVLALGEGARQTVARQIDSFGGDVVTVRPGKLTTDETGKITGYDLLANFNASTLTEQDLRIVSTTPGVESAAPSMGLRGTIAGAERSTDDAQIIATNNNLPAVLGQKMKVGEFVSEDIDRNTVVLGSALATELLGSDQTIGQIVSIRGQDYTLIGVLQVSGMSLAVGGLYDANRAAYVTLDAGKAINQGIAQIQSITFRLSDAADKKEVISNVNERLRTAHGADDVAVIGSEAALGITERLLLDITTYTAAVAAISLVVGGIGVMNIMLVAVTERTREIGIRKAVGATNAQIMRQFLIESILMSLTGGILGIALAYAITIGISFQFSFNATFTWTIIGLSLGVSVIVGVLFGTFPAFRASRKDPIEALRQMQ